MIRASQTSVNEKEIWTIKCTEEDLGVDDGSS